MKIPFDVETAKLALAAGTGRIVTRRGYPVEITCWDDSHDTWPVVGKINGVFFIFCWTTKGRWGHDPEIDTDLDLFIETDLDL